jgi:hypothetical protein
LDLFKFSCDAGTNILVLGPAGGGKTAMAQQAANEMGLPHIYVDLSVLEAPDFVGLPTIRENERGARMVEYATPAFMPCVDVVDTSKPPFVLIFDELDKSRPELQAPLLEIFHERSINGRKLHVKSILATGNLPDEGAFSQPISHALTNRCSVYKMELNFQSWQPWAVRNGVNGLIVGFLDRNEDQLLKAPAEGDPTAYCHPSPRAWSNAAQDLDKAGPKASLEFQTKLIAGRVGMGAATKFAVWLEFYKEVEPFVDALVRDGKHPPEMSIDKLIVCAISSTMRISSVCREEEKKGKKDQKSIDRVHGTAAKVTSWISKIESEFQIAAFKNAFDMELVREWSLTKVPNFMQTVEKVHKIIKTSD